MLVQNKTKENIKNSAVAISDLMARFMRPSSSSEAEMIELVARYSLQLRPDQQLVLNRLQMLAYDTRIPKEVKESIEAFVPMFMETKRYHDTINFIGRAIEAFSLKRFIDSKSIQGQVVTQK